MAAPQPQSKSPLFPAAPVAVPSSPPASASRSTLDLRSALLSTLRAWLVTRDHVIWCLCSAGDPDEHECRLEVIDLTQAQPSIDRLNSLRSMALDFAKCLASKRETPGQIVDEALTELLSTESPRFTLHLPEFPNSF